MQLKNIITDLQEYMFTSNNLNRFTKHMNQTNINPKSSVKNIDKNIDKNHKTSTPTRLVENKTKVVNSHNPSYFAGSSFQNSPDPLVVPLPDFNESQSSFFADIIAESSALSVSPPRVKNNNNNLSRETTRLSSDKKYKKETFYKPKQKDSLFWCFYILKYGYSNYEMEINNQYFTVEKREKFKYIEMLRNNKDLLKIHKIKPFTELEDDLANKDKISVKTFFALCILENINVLLVDKRKIFELTCIDIDDKHQVNVIHRNRKNYEHHIELNVTDTILMNYRETYYKSNTLDASIKSISSYKFDELVELCKKLNIDISSSKEEGKNKMTKKDIYEILVLNY